jgi:hypothetical protein
MDELLDRKFVRDKQAAKLLGVSLATVRRWAERGVRGVRLATTRLGAARWVAIDGLRSFVRALSASGRGPPSNSGSGCDQQKAKDAGVILDGQVFRRTRKRNKEKKLTNDHT